jgi:hypothetical protein
MRQTATIDRTTDMGLVGSVSGSPARTGSRSWVWVGKASLVVGLMRMGLGFGRVGMGMKGLWLNVVDGQQSERDRWRTRCWARRLGQAKRSMNCFRQRPFQGGTASSASSSSLFLPKRLTFS